MNPHKTLFSRNIESLNLLDAPPISSGQKVFIPEALMPHLLDFHHKELAKFLKPGPQIVEVIVHEDYGTRIGEAWIDRRAGITLCLPFESTRREQHAIVTTMGRPVVFATQNFLSHIKQVNSETHEWELVP